MPPCNLFFILVPEKGARTKPGPDWTTAEAHKQYGQLRMGVCAHDRLFFFFITYPACHFQDVMPSLLA